MNFALCLPSCIGIFYTTHVVDDDIWHYPSCSEISYNTKLSDYSVVCPVMSIFPAISYHHLCHSSCSNLLMNIFLCPTLILSLDNLLCCILQGYIILFTAVLFSPRDKNILELLSKLSGCQPMSYQTLAWSSCLNGGNSPTPWTYSVDNGFFV